MLPGDTRQAGSLPGQVNGPYRTGIRAGITMMMSSLSVLSRIGARRHRTADIRGLLTQIPDAGFLTRRCRGNARRPAVPSENDRFRDSGPGLEWCGRSLGHWSGQRSS